MVKNTLNIGKISEGFVLDHIEAGKSMDIYKYLKLDKLDCCVAIIKNAKSNKMGKKDIIKIECPIDIIDHRLHLVAWYKLEAATGVRAIPDECQGSVSDVALGHLCREPQTVLALLHLKRPDAHLAPAHCLRAHM